MAESLSPTDDPLAALQVLDRLEVGPVRVEPQRIVMPYSVVPRADVVPPGDAPTSFEFVYRYEEEVFGAGGGDLEERNLASLIGAQPVLNYGLFCREIVFHGPFARPDRRFLTDMAKNTAREIYVKKIAQPTPFLTDAIRALPLAKCKSYLQARLRFPDPVPGLLPRGKAWATDDRKVAVLSSGGKESLLTHGLLTEVGQDVHPCFVNESGKHWFTALNAHRHFAREVPNTARVWTNSDRLFPWMLRHLPFIRPDFSRLRADIYPIRLWTVALFLFGVLPLLRKRGVGRLVIGDEYDTTLRGNFEGIPHFEGLFDQSRYFDHALTRFFGRKRWGVKQFSILRPLSELLIQKLLVERYPGLQRLQVSCHAAHADGPLVRPCGRCEKCSRVVGMLVGMGADPTRCGYTAEQIDQSLKRLAANGASQERPCQEHLADLLQRRGRLPGGKLGSASAHPRAEVLKLRFDRRRSPMDDVPADLREPLYELLMRDDVVGGALQRRGRRWVPFDPRSEEGPQSVPPAAATDRASNGNGETAGPRPWLLGELTWPEAKARFAETDIALLPVGALEQHGPHLPLDTDAYDADLLAREAASRCTAPKPLVLPVIPFGVSYHHEDFAGTISVGPETLSRFVHEVGLSVARHGIRKLIIVNGHGGNAPTLHFAAQLINRDAHIFTCVESGETSDADIGRLAETPGDVHAGEIETSTTLANRPDMVRMDLLTSFVPRFPSRYLDFDSPHGVEWYVRTAKISPEGVLGDPTKATREKGRRMWRMMIDHMVALIEALQGVPLEELFSATWHRSPTTPASDEARTETDGPDET